MLTNAHTELQLSLGSDSEEDRGKSFKEVHNSFWKAQRLLGDTGADVDILLEAAEMAEPIVWKKPNEGTEEKNETEDKRKYAVSTKEPLT